MDKTNSDAFIHAYNLFRLASLTIKDTDNLQFYVYIKGWITALRYDLPWTDIYCEGHFPANLTQTRTLQYQSIQFGGNYERTECVFECSLDTEHGTIGLTDFKRKEIGLDPEEPISDVVFTHSVMDPDIGTNGIFGDDDCLFILKSDLFSYCEKHGVFDIQDRYHSLLSELKNKSKLKQPDQHSAQEKQTVFHPHTSQALLDLVQANDKFWKNFDPEELQDSAPTKEIVVDWLSAKGYSRSLSEKMDTILRDGRNKPGGRPEKS